MLKAELCSTSIDILYDSEGMENYVDTLSPNELKEEEMKILEGKLENGKRVAFNADRIDVILEHGISPESKTVICFGTETYTVMATYTAIMGSGIRGGGKDG